VATAPRIGVTLQNASGRRHGEGWLRKLMFDEPPDMHIALPVGAVTGHEGARRSRHPNLVPSRVSQLP